MPRAKVVPFRHHAKGSWQQDDLKIIGFSTNTKKWNAGADRFQADEQWRVAAKGIIAPCQMW